jgi:hypothetical protein
MLVVRCLSFNSHFSSATFIPTIPYGLQNTAENKTFQIDIYTRNYRVTNSENFRRVVACKVQSAAELTQFTGYQQLNMLGKKAYHKISTKSE